MVSADGCGHIILVSPIGPKVSEPESVDPASVVQVELPRLQSTRKPALPSSPKVTVYFDGDSIVVLGCSSLIDSMVSNCQVVPISGSAVGVDPQPATLSRAAADRAPMARGVRMRANLPSVAGRVPRATPAGGSVILAG